MRWGTNKQTHEGWYAYRCGGSTRSSKYNKQLNAKHGTNNTCFLVYDTFCVVFTNCKTYGERTKKDILGVVFCM